jgi:hypothetical protein
MFLIWKAGRQEGDSRGLCNGSMAENLERSPGYWREAEGQK